MLGTWGPPCPARTRVMLGGRRGAQPHPSLHPATPIRWGFHSPSLISGQAASAGGKWGRPRWGGGLPASPPQRPDRVLALRNAWLHLPPFPPPVLSSKASERHPAGVLEKTKPPSRNGTRLSASPAAHPEAGGRAGGRLGHRSPRRSSNVSFPT